MLKGKDHSKHSDNVKEDYLDIYEGINSELNYVAKPYETADITTAYISKNYKQERKV